MSKTVSPRIIAGLWGALGKAQPGAPDKAASEIVSRTAARGWASCVAIESYLIATDARPLWSFLTVRELLEAFGIPLQWTYRRPRSGDGCSFGIEMVAAYDFAALLIFLKAMGFAIDPTALCEALRPQLRTREHLTAAEIAVWWHPKEQHRSAPQCLATGPTLGRCSDTLTTPAGYVAELYRDDEGTPSAIRVTAPKQRRVRSLTA